MGVFGCSQQRRLVDPKLQPGTNKSVDGLYQQDYGGGGGGGEVVEAIMEYIARLEEVNMLKKTAKQQSYPRFS